MESQSDGLELEAGPDDSGRRLDKVLRRVLPELALSEIYAALRKGKIRVNGKKAHPELRLAEGDRILFRPSLSIGELPSASSPCPEGEDDLASLGGILVLATNELLFLNKPAGELSQDAPGEASALVARVRAALASRRSASLSFSPGPLHRLDRNTSGILVFSRSAPGARAFTALVRERRIEKSYLALVDGEAREAAEWEDRIVRDEATRTSRVLPPGSASGDAAAASMRPLISSPSRSLLLVELHSGLSHQIRVQASARGLPLSGDRKYGGSEAPDGALAGGYLLHALALGFPEPPFPDLPRRVVAPLPAAARSRLERIFGEAALARALETALEEGVSFPRRME